MRRWLSLLFCIVLVLTLPITALAHPGRTDSSGGHTDRSTGEYHYHHGQPAHDHYDADGDGDVDCPYDFKDATKKDMHVENSQSDSFDNKPVKESTKVTNKKADHKRSLWDAFPWDLFWILFGIVFPWILIYFIGMIITR